MLWDVSQHRIVDSRTIGGLLFLKVSDDCDRGATVQWTPADAATQLREVRASDGRPAAVILRPNHDRFTITIVGDTGRTTVKVDLPPETPIPTPSLID
ncbi:hypothetical protein [Leifsonia shinshuensis]|uniref:Uncharacterized protein n=1 Tax=Leifsonia shinshuensis TaxID=150026 RepID=A0A7G6Y809_9MICO|nr:hypothetical protein [Leifsonia shinshuensis]QNE34624.1 hypothetical protein F1C12_05475 [Leifsonia shinshuensis]